MLVGVFRYILATISICIFLCNYSTYIYIYIYIFILCQQQEYPEHNCFVSQLFQTGPTVSWTGHQHHWNGQGLAAWLFSTDASKKGCLFHRRTVVSIGYEEAITLERLGVPYSLYNIHVYVYAAHIYIYIYIFPVQWGAKELRIESSNHLKDRSGKIEATKLGTLW